MKKILSLTVFIMSSTFVFTDYVDFNKNGKMDIYEDSSRLVEERVADLLSQMTLGEKISQMYQKSISNFAAENGVSAVVLSTVLGKDGCGTLESPFIENIHIGKTINQAQTYLIKNTRLGIPAAVIAECLHGHMAYNSTIFPQAIGLASTWNDELIEDVGRAIAVEAWHSGVRQALSPVLDVALDPRWGRIEETYGEDPYLVSEIGCAFIRGMQGHGKSLNNYSGRYKNAAVRCTAKHFAAYGLPFAGINLGPVSVGPSMLYNYFLYPFREAVMREQITAVMPAYNEIDGKPMHAHKNLIHDVLRNEFGFNGYIFSDYSAVAMMEFFHHSYEDKATAAAAAIKAGVDLEAPNDECFKHIPELIKKGLLNEKEIDTAVERILTFKFKAGCFENPYANIEELKKIVADKQHTDLALKVAEESIILLKNKLNVLPLRNNSRKIAVIGPNANQVQFGDYSATERNQDGITVFEGIKAAASPDSKIIYSEGVSLWKKSKLKFPAAKRAVSGSSAVVVVLGGSSAVLSGIGWGKASDGVNTCGEGFDFNKVSLPGYQKKLLKQIKKWTTAPIILVLVNGRPYADEGLYEMADAVVEAWYPGERGGEAVANILFGKKSPCGRLPVSIPKTTGHIPSNYNYKPSGRGFYKSPGTEKNPGRDYVFSEPGALYPFGFGLSYTKFNYSKFTVTKIEQNKWNVSVTIRNTGKMDGSEVVQLYISDKVSSETRPVKELKGFRKIFLKKDKTKEVEFVLTEKDLSYWYSEQGFVVEPGTFSVMIGKSSEDIVFKEDIAW